MNEKELKDQVIKGFVNLQRVKSAKDREIEYQEKILVLSLKINGK